MNLLRSGSTLLLLFFCACTDSAAPPPAVVPDQPAAAEALPAGRRVDQRCAVLLLPDSVRIEAERQRLGEGVFAAAADDYQFYLSEAETFLDRMKLPVLSVEGRAHVYFLHQGKTVQHLRTDSIKQPWAIYYFQPGKLPLQIDMTQYAEAYRTYFEK